MTPQTEAGGEPAGEEEMADYIALLRKDADSDYGVEFPDFPGCVTAGRTLEEARAAAQEALELHLEGMAEDGIPIPVPSSLDAIFASDWETTNAIPFLVEPKQPEPSVVRVNVTFKPAVLRVLDDYATGRGLTRAAALERAVTVVTQAAAERDQPLLHQRTIPTKGRIVGQESRSGRFILVPEAQQRSGAAHSEIIPSPRKESAKGKARGSEKGTRRTRQQRTRRSS